MIDIQEIATEIQGDANEDESNNLGNVETHR